MAGESEQLSYASHPLGYSLETIIDRNGHFIWVISYPIPIFIYHKAFILILNLS